MSHTVGTTLSIHDRSAALRGPTPQPVLVVVLECSRPASGGARFSLAGSQRISIGRGGARRVARTRTDAGQRMRLDIPDRWMSSNHVTIERSFGRWILEDAGSKNGTTVGGVLTRRAALADGDLIELGHTLLAFHDRIPIGDDLPADLDPAAAAPRPAGLTTLVPAYARALAKLEQLAAAPIPVLVTGESGTGKEVLARAVHALSGRPGELVAVNCGAIPPTLIESELFGHKKGAFSGATEDRVGLVRAANRGTLFLDEIGDLPAASQAALLRVLQEREVTPVGATRPVPVDLRLVSATHRDLEQMIDRDAFRRDLYARIAGFRIEAPPLRERRDDLGVLVAALWSRVAPADHPGFDPEAAQMLFAHRWPLNIRELETCLTSAAVLAGAQPIGLEHLPASIRSPQHEPPAPALPALSPGDEKLRDDLVAALRTHGGNISAVARQLGKDRKQIQRWVKRLRIDAAAFRA